jgi:hypothetical protein
MRENHQDFKDFLTGTDLAYNWFSRHIEKPKLPEPVTYNNTTKRCIMCRQVRNVGILISSTNQLRTKIVGNVFNDTHFLRCDEPESILCDKCFMMLRGKGVIQWSLSYKKFILTKDEMIVFHNSKTKSPKFDETICANNEFIKFLFSPPEPPFAFFIFDGSNYGHLFWKARASWSRDRFFIQYCDRDIMIDREFLIELIDEAVEILKKYNKYLTSYLQLFATSNMGITFSRKVREAGLGAELQDVILRFCQKVPWEYAFLFSPSSKIPWSAYFKERLKS